MYLMFNECYENNFPKINLKNRNDDSFSGSFSVCALMYACVFIHIYV